MYLIPIFIYLYVHDANYGITGEMCVLYSLQPKATNEVNFLHWIPDSYCSTSCSFEPSRLPACWNHFTLELVINVTYTALLAYITADNAELTGYSTTTNVRREL